MASSNLGEWYDVLKVNQFILCYGQDGKTDDET